MPKEPGVYLFKTQKNNLLYIGKAKNLKNRVSQYKLLSYLQGKTKILINQIVSVQYIICSSELQALLLEAQLISYYRPKYNLRLKDDKSPLYIIITDEPYPRVLVTHKTAIGHAPYAIRYTFGPFISGYNAKKILRILRRIFPFCNATVNQKQKLQACFYSHIGLCAGACTQKITRRKYIYIIKNLAIFLKGDEHKVIKNLTASMRRSAKAQNYEAAQTIKDQLSYLQAIRDQNISRSKQDEMTQALSSQIMLKSLKSLLKLKTTPNRIEAYDIANLQGKFATGSMVVFTLAKPDNSQYRHFKIRSIKNPNDVAMIKQVISRRIKRLAWHKPNLIVIDGGKGQVNATLSLLSQAKKPWPSTPVIGIAKKQEQLIYKNKIINLPRSFPALKLIQHLRDESHRFSRRLHHHYHQKSLLSNHKNW